MKISSLLTGLALVAACSAHSVRGECRKIITLTLTTYTQNPAHDNGTETTIPGSVAKTYNTQAILNLLARDKQAEGQWSSSVFPVGAQLVSTNHAWVVLDKANNVLAEVSDILSGTNAGNGMEVMSGAQNDASQLSCPSVKTMELLAITFDDTAIAGGNHISFFLQGLSTKTVSDTTPTKAGVYTETDTGVMTGAAGQGTWSNGMPFVLTANVTSAGRATFGQSSPSSGFAPASLAGYTVTCARSGQPGLALSFGNGTWGQSGTGSDTNADDYCAGVDTYLKTGPNTAVMSNMDIGMLSWLATTNYTTVDITFTSASSATAKWSDLNGSGTTTMTAITKVSNLVPATIAGKTVESFDSKGAAGPTTAFASDGTFTQTQAGAVTASGTYTLTQYSPTVAIIEYNFTDANDAGAVAYVEATFTSATAGKFFYSYYQNPSYGQNPSQSQIGAFKVE